MHMCVWGRGQDAHVSPAIIAGQVPGPERTPFLWFRQQLARQKPSLVIDAGKLPPDQEHRAHCVAGSNVGLFTILALSMGHFVLAVDSMPEHVEMVARSAALNDLSERLIIVGTPGHVVGSSHCLQAQNAVSDHCGIGYTNLVQGNPG